MNIIFFGEFVVSMFLTMNVTATLCQVSRCRCVLLCRDSVAVPVVATADTHKTSHSLILFVIYCM